MKRNLGMGKGKEERQEGGDRAGHWRKIIVETISVEGWEEDF